MRWRVVRLGSWLYDQTVQKGVWIVEADYDFWYELGEADEQDEPPENPHLNAAGHQYYALFREPRPSEPFWPDTLGADSIEEAIEHAQAKLPSPIIWSSQSNVMGS